MAKRFGDVAAVTDVSLEVPAGCVYGLVGPNGAGKTTTMRLVLGIVDPDAGAITWHGEPVARLSRRRLAYVPEERGLYPRMRVDEQLCLFGELAGRSPADARGAARRWIDRLELEPYRRRLGADLSKGNARKAQLAVALMNAPELIVLDEPFEGLDPVNVRLVKGVLREAVGQGATFLLSSHTMDFVQDLCDGVALIDRGVTVVAGTLDTVRAHSGRRLVRLRFEPADPALYDRFAAQTGLAGGISRSDGVCQFEASPDLSPSETLDRARALGDVRFFSFGPPDLEEAYVELVGGAARGEA